MNEELLSPSVPTLSAEWIAQRTQHLVAEVTSPTPRRRRRVIVTGVGSGAVATTAVLVGLLGPWASPAFAGWSADPTSPSSSQLSDAEASCATLATNLANLPGATESATLPPLELSDVRGPYSLLVYGTTNPALCVVGDSLSSLHEDGATIGMSSAPADGNSVVHQSTTEGASTNNSAAPPAPGAAVVNMNNTTISGNDQAFTVIEGSVGSQVTGATLLLDDGSSVVATVSNGLFAAWWPSSAAVSNIQVTTTSGVN